ncbi:hypothetical protein CFOL_v3_28078 [Cephalotus follicularis]|uniref:Uncharacterized protein n=1 Tax=Cephalotus follicularis TaxID=3775 RepID=A0A1Q3CWM7_CEPFO|nr:hypothetical protein CFOL_v3_28078 [Cephalotus follicularis]
MSIKGSRNGYFEGRKVRDSLNQLRVTLYHSLMLLQIDNDSDEEVNADEDDVKELCKQLEKFLGSLEKNSEDLPDTSCLSHRGDFGHRYWHLQASCSKLSLVFYFFNEQKIKKLLS